MESKEAFKELTSCSSCQKLLKKPKILQCLHAYCSPCLTELAQGEDEGVACMKCRETQDISDKKGLAGISRDILAESLIYMGRTGDSSDEMPCSSCDVGREPAVERCLDCGEFLCNECTGTHRRARNTRDHKIIPLNDANETEEIARRNIYCELHPSEELRYFCEQSKCKQMICRECTIVKHKGHKFIYMTESAATKEVMTNLESLVKKVQEKAKNVNKAIEDVDATSDLITGSIAGLKKSIRTIATEMVRHIRVAEEEMITEIDRVQSRKFHGLNKQKRDLRMHLGTFDIGQTYTKYALKYLSEIELFLAKEPIIERLDVLAKKKINYDPVEDNNLRHVCLTKQGSKMARGSLGYLELNGNTVVNGCVRDLTYNMDRKRGLKKRDIEAFSHLKGITVDIKGPEGEFINPLKIQKGTPGEYGAEFQTEREGVHSVVISMDGVAVHQLPLQVIIGDTSDNTPPCRTAARSFGRPGAKSGQLYDVHGIVVDNQGRIVVTDSKHHQIQIFDMTGQFLHKFGSFGSEPGEFDNPHGVTVDQHGDLIVADTGNCRIQIFDVNGKYVKSIGCHNDEEEPFHPYAVAVDQRNYVIAVDRARCLVRAFNEKKEKVMEFGSLGSNAGRFINPSYIAVNQGGHILISDMGNDRVQVFTSSGQPLFSFGKTGSGLGELRWPTGIAVKMNGDIVVADSCNNRVQIFRSDGTYQSCHGPLLYEDDSREIKLPEGVAVNYNGDVIIADWGNNRVQILGAGDNFGP